MSESGLKTKTQKGIIWRFFDQSANMLMQFIIGIVMARLLSPSDYGISALPAIFLIVADALIDGGFTLALIRKPDVSDKDLSTSFYYSISIGVFLYIIIFFCAPLIASFYNQPVLVPLVRVAALNFLWGPIATPQKVILNRRVDFKTSARISITTRVICGPLGILIAYLGYGVWALVIPTTVGSLLALAMTMYAVRWYPTKKFSKESFRYLWGFGNKILATRLIDTTFDNIAPVIIGKYYSPASLGVFNRAQGYATLPSVNIANTLQNVTLPVLSKIQDDDERLLNSYNKLITTSAFVVFPIMMMLAALAKPLIITMITDKWYDCILLLQILCFSYMWAPVSYLNCNLIQVKGRSDVFLRIAIIKKISFLCLMCLSLPFGLKWFCFAYVVNMIISIYINTQAVGKIMYFGFFKQMKLLLPIICLSLVMCIVSFSFNYIFDNFILVIIFGGLAGAAVYIGGAYLFKFPELGYALDFINLKKTRKNEG